MHETISTDCIEAMIERIRPAWMVREATPAVGGYHHVYLLSVKTDGDERQCVLKATPEDSDPVCGNEARLLTLLADHSDLGVPEVIGVVDADDTLLAPFFLAEHVSGANYTRAELPSLSDELLERAAYSLGGQLAGLHQVTLDGALSVDGYGIVAIDRAGDLDGERPSSEPAQVVVNDPETDWRSYLQATVDAVVPELRETRFEGMADAVDDALGSRIGALTGEFEPALCRVDHSIENTVLDPESAEVRALLDWEFCVAATPAYDLAFAVDSFSGGLRALLPGTPDRGDMVERALLTGYRDVCGDDVVAQYRANGDCYRLLSDLHAMVNFESWFEQSTATAAETAAAADPLREHVRERIRVCRARTR